MNSPCTNPFTCTKLHQIVLALYTISMMFVFHGVFDDSSPGSSPRYFFPLMLTVVPPGPGLGPVPMSQFGTISRQISRHSSSSASSSASMVSATGTYRRAPSSSSQFSVPQSHLNGAPTYQQNPAPGEYLSWKVQMTLVIFSHIHL